MGKSSAINGHLPIFSMKVRYWSLCFFLRYIQGDDHISQESCAVPNLTRLESLRWSVDLEGTAWTPPGKTAAALDVWVLCSQSFKLLSMGMRCTLGGCRAPKSMKIHIFVVWGEMEGFGGFAIVFWMMNVDAKRGCRMTQE